MSRWNSRSRSSTRGLGCLRERSTPGSSGWGQATPRWLTRSPWRLKPPRVSTRSIRLSTGDCPCRRSSPASSSRRVFCCAAYGIARATPRTCVVLPRYADEAGRTLSSISWSGPAPSTPSKAPGRNQASYSSATTTVSPGRSAPRTSLSMKRRPSQAFMPMLTTGTPSACSTAALSRPNARLEPPTKTTLGPSWACSRACLSRVAPAKSLPSGRPTSSASMDSPAASASVAALSSSRMPSCSLELEVDEALGIAVEGSKRECHEHQGVIGRPAHPYRPAWHFEADPEPHRGIGGDHGGDPEHRHDERRHRPPHYKRRPCRTEVTGRHPRQQLGGAVEQVGDDVERVADTRGAEEHVAQADQGEGHEHPQRGVQAWRPCQPGGLDDALAQLLAQHRGDQVAAVQRAPDHEGPVGPVPQAAHQEGQQQRQQELVVPAQADPAGA